MTAAIQLLAGHTSPATTGQPAPPASLAVGLNRLPLSVANTNAAPSYEHHRSADRGTVSRRAPDCHCTWHRPQHTTSTALGHCANHQPTKTLANRLLHRHSELPCSLQGAPAATSHGLKLHDCAPSRLGTTTSASCILRRLQRLLHRLGLSCPLWHKGRAHPLLQASQTATAETLLQEVIRHCPLGLRPCSAA